MTSLIPRPLDGVKVLDLSRFIAGPHAALLMGDMGADVVKVESRSGEPSRRVNPKINGESTYFMALNRSKRGVVLDMRNSAGLDVLGRLIAQADILIENFRPGTLDEMGFTKDRIKQLNPQLIVVSISGYGQTGPYAQRGCFDSVAQAMSGLSSLTGDPEGTPMRAAFYVGDYGAALHATIGALLAVISRAKSGKGQHVDISLVESLVSMTTTFVPGYTGADVIPTRDGNGNSHAAPADLFETADGHVQIAASTDDLFRSLTTVMGRPDLLLDERFSSHGARVSNSKALKQVINAWTRSFSKQQLSELLARGEVPAGPVLKIAEVVENEQLRDRNFFAEIDHPVAGKAEFPGPVIRLSDTPALIERAAPLLGQHNGEVLSDWIGVHGDELDQLRHQGAFG